MSSISGLFLHICVYVNLLTFLCNYVQSCIINISPLAEPYWWVGISYRLTGEQSWRKQSSLFTELTPWMKSYCLKLLKWTPSKTAYYHTPRHWHDRCNSADMLKTDIGKPVIQTGNGRCFISPQLRLSDRKITADFSYKFSRTKRT